MLILADSLAILSKSSFLYGMNSLFTQEFDLNNKYNDNIYFLKLNLLK